jgi:hypothetical protein
VLATWDGILLRAVILGQALEDETPDQTWDRLCIRRVGTGANAHVIVRPAFTNPAEDKNGKAGTVGLFVHLVKDAKFGAVLGSFEDALANPVTTDELAATPRGNSWVSGQPRCRT